MTAADALRRLLAEVEAAKSQFETSRGWVSDRAEALVQAGKGTNGLLNALERLALDGLAGEYGGCGAPAGQGSYCGATTRNGKGLTLLCNACWERSQPSKANNEDQP